jgi:hypothetical protein
VGEVRDDPNVNIRAVGDGGDEEGGIEMACEVMKDLPPAAVLNRRP